MSKRVSVRLSDEQHAALSRVDPDVGRAIRLLLHERIGGPLDFPRGFASLGPAERQKVGASGGKMKAAAKKSTATKRRRG